MAETILIVAHGHPELSAGGGEIVAYQLFDGLRRREGITAVFLAATDDPALATAAGGFTRFKDRPDEMLFLGRDVEPFFFSMTNQRLTNAFIELLSRLKPDVVHFHHYMNIGLDLYSAARQHLPQAKIILTLHEYHAICAHWGQMVKTGSLALCHRATPQDCSRCLVAKTPAEFESRDRFIRSHLSHVDRFVAPSRFLRERYVAWGIPPAKIVAIDNGTEPIDPPSSRPLGRGERRSVFGFFGQINPYKGLVPLLSAFDQLQRYPTQMADDLRLRVHGAYLELNEPSFVATVRDLLSRTSSHVSFSGAYERHELHRLMADIDWVVVPSIWWENAPLVIEEALAHRRPVICSNIGGMAEKVRPDRDGLHFPVGDPAALARTLLRAASEPDLWERLRQTMRTPATIEQFVDEHLNLYRGEAGSAQTQPFALAARSPPSNRAARLATTLVGAAQIVTLDRGLYLLDIGCSSDAADGAATMIHVGVFPSAGSDDVRIFGYGMRGPDVWFGADGGTLVAESLGPDARLIVTVYGGRDVVTSAPLVATRQISDTVSR